MQFSTKIKSIKPVGKEIIWDMEVARNGSYISEDIISKNSSSPNQQNRPSRAKGKEYDEGIQDIGPSLKRAFIAPPPSEEFPEGFDMIVADLSQIELRLAADFTGEKNLSSVYLQTTDVDGRFFYTGDVHTQTSQLVGCSRSDGKTCNFALLYGAGAPRFARIGNFLIDGTTIFDVARAERLREGFFRAYPKLKSMQDKLGNAFRFDNQRLFSTISGRYKHFYGDKNVSKGTILNAKVQGSAADILEYVVYIIQQYAYPQFPGLALIGQVHDELIYVVPKRYSKEAGLIVKYVMEHPWYELSLPLLASAKICDSWAAKEDKSLPEIGTFFAEVNGEKKLYTRDNWSDYLNLPKDTDIGATSSCAMLSREELEYCATIIPDEKAPTTRKKKKRTLTRAETLARREELAQ